MTDPLEFEITDTERRHLKAMLASPGFIVLEKINKAYIDAATLTAQLASRNDPLGNAQTVAEKWAYVAMAEQALEVMKAGVNFELEMLKRNEAPASDPADLAKRRRLHASFGALDPIPER